jgi:surfactin synthase thioesterase subunit/glycosyltransferase involved in cell wall biosynthesis
MRILLAHNSLYYPSHGGGDKSNRLLMEALAEQGHDVRVVTRVERFGQQDHDRLLFALGERGVQASMDAGAVRYSLNGVDVRVLSLNSAIRPFFAARLAEFDPDVIITSTDDPGQLLFELAVRAPRARVVHLVRATIAVPFGPDSSAPNPQKAELLHHADGIVGVSRYVAEYVKQWGRLDAIHVPISLLDRTPEYPDLGSFDSQYVSIVNPCAVKGIGIFLEMADRMPDVAFAAVPTWGATTGDMAAMRARTNVTLLPPVDNIDELLRVTRVVLVPSVWAEARSRIVVEAMSRGVPVVASNAGGIPEAKLGVPYLVPVNIISHYRASVDTNMVPVAEVPPQNVEPWIGAVRRLLSDRKHWTEIAQRSRDAALEYARTLNVLPFERYLKEVIEWPKKAGPQQTALSDEKRKLLALRLKQKATAAKSPEKTWFAGLDSAPAGQPLLFCFPYAGAGTMVYSSWREKLQPAASVVAVRLPGRESRLVEPFITRMEELIPALAAALERAVEGREFSLFGHSMGAGIAFELNRYLRRHARPLPHALMVSAARAPQYRLGWEPGPEPADEELVDQLRRLEGIPADVLDNPELLRIALPVLRADAHLYRHYVYQPEEGLPVPIRAYGGKNDPNVRPEHLEAWREQTAVSFLRREFSGGHFFFSPDFLDALRGDVATQV